jgi:hypothetical protein
MDKTLQNRVILARYRKIEEGQRQAAWRAYLQLALRGHSTTRRQCLFSGQSGRYGGSALRETHEAARCYGAVVGTAIAWAVVVRAQQPTIPVVGFLDSRSTKTVGSRLRGFRQGLGEGGYAEGRNVAIEYRWAEDQLDRLP